MKWLYLTVASFLFVGSGVGLLVINTNDHDEHARDVLGTTVHEPEPIETEVTPVDTVEPEQHASPPVDEGVQRQLQARTDPVNHTNCVEDDSTSINIDEQGDGVNITVNSSQLAQSGDATNDGSGNTASGDVKVCNSTDINVEIR